MLEPDERRLVTWVEAAAWALDRGQTPAAQRLLVLTIDAAVRAAHLDVAEQARQRLIALNPRHQAARFDSASAAMKNDDFLFFVSSVRRQLSFEQAEQMVTARPTDDRRGLNDAQPLGQQLTAWLTK